MHPFKLCFISLFALTSFVMALPAMAANITDNILNAPPGLYQVDPAHSRVSFKIGHLGFSFYPGRFDGIDGQLTLNNTAPEHSTLDVTIYPNTINLGDAALEEDLRGNRWLDVIRYPKATFHVTSITRTSLTTGKISGDFTLMDMTQNVVLDTKLIGTGTNSVTGKQVIGFNATGLLHRSDYRLTNLLPMISDDVTLEINVEFDKIDP